MMPTPIGRAPAPTSIRAHAARITPAALESLRDILGNTESTDADRINAARVVLAVAMTQPEKAPYAEPERAPYTVAVADDDGKPCPHSES